MSFLLSLFSALQSVNVTPVPSTRRTTRSRKALAAATESSATPKAKLFSGKKSDREEDPNVTQSDEEMTEMCEKAEEVSNTVNSHEN